MNLSTWQYHICSSLHLLLYILLFSMFLYGLDSLRVTVLSIFLHIKLSAILPEIIQIQTSNLDPPFASLKKICRPPIFGKYKFSVKHWEYCITFLKSISFDHWIIRHLQSCFQISGFPVLFRMLWMLVTMNKVKFNYGNHWQVYCASLFVAKATGHYSNPFSSNTFSVKKLKSWSLGPMTWLNYIG